MQGRNRRKETQLHHQLQHSSRRARPSRGCTLSKLTVHKRQAREQHYRLSIPAANRNLINNLMLRYGPNHDTHVYIRLMNEFLRYLLHCLLAQKPADALVMLLRALGYNCQDGSTSYKALGCAMSPRYASSAGEKTS